MESDADLLAARKTLLASITEVMGVARNESDLGRSPDAYLYEVTRLTLRLMGVQEMIEARDLD